MLKGWPQPLDIRIVASPVLVVAPHPDDESLSCGGLVARLRRQGGDVTILIVSDGGASHPRSRSWPSERLARRRKAEANTALDRLAVARHARRFWWERDSGVPGVGEAGFDKLVRRAERLLHRLRPRTVIVPWRRDPHRDHRASTLIFLAALRRTGRSPLLLEYPGWTGILPISGRSPRRSEVRTWRVAIERVRGVKRRAIDAHRSQLGHIVDDDPTGFVLTGQLRRRFERPYEIYWEALSWRHAEI